MGKRRQFFLIVESQLINVKAIIYLEYHNLPIIEIIDSENNHQ